MKILIINGPNMSQLHARDGYGNASLQQVCQTIQTYAQHKNIIVEFYNSDIEGEIVSKINTFDGYGIVINPAAYSHYSIAIADALQIFKGKKVEVHITNLANREQARKISITAQACDGYISGLGIYGYILGVKYIVDGTKYTSNTLAKGDQ